MKKILCIEDCLESIVVLKHLLREYDLTICSSIKEASTLVAENHFSVILVDIELPDGRGHELMPMLQKDLHQTAVIFISAHSAYNEKLMAFSLGAVDYVQKPYDPRELKLRIEAQIKRMSLIPKQEKQIIKIGRLTCDLEEQKIYRRENGDIPLDVTSIEFKIFRLLSKEPKKIFPRDIILEKVWGRAVAITARTVDVHISNLRRKLTDTNVSIQHKHGHGYFILSSLNNPGL